jgi:hypothetical protein
MQTPKAGSRQLDDGYVASNTYASLNRRSTDPNPKDSLTKGQSLLKDLISEEGLSHQAAQGKGSALEAFEQLPFAESVKILSEAMKAKVRQTQATPAKPALADDGGAVHPKAGESLNHLLDSLSSALEKAGLETGNHATLQRILGDIRNSVQYGPNTSGTGGVGGIKKGPNPGLLNLSA